MKKRIIICAAVAALLSACSVPPERVLLATEAAGLTDVSIKGQDFFHCGEDDTLATKFEATTSKGTRVKGVVCGGVWAKGDTVRIIGRAG